MTPLRSGTAVEEAGQQVPGAALIPEFALTLLC